MKTSMLTAAGTIKSRLANALPVNHPLGSALRRFVFHATIARYHVAGALIPDDRASCYCPCCNSKLRKWKVARYAEQPHLYDTRRYANTPQDVVCPACGSIPRHRIIAWQLDQRLEQIRGKRILHFAPERCLTYWFESRGMHPTTADLHSPADLSINIQDTGLPNASYDIVICNHVLEHVDDYKLALQELRRILSPDGLLVCSFPIDPRYATVYEDPTITTKEGRLAHFGQHDHLRVFGTDSAQILTQAGFEVEVARGVDCPDTIRPVTGPADYDSPDIFFCRKPES